MTFRCARAVAAAASWAVRWTVLWAMSWTVLWVGPMGCGVDAPTRTDLLLITVDTLRADRLTCYGGPPDLGRAMCDLAEEGTRFAWAFSTAPSTTPSVASLLTSLYPAFHGVSQGVHVYLSDRAITVAELLRDAGYATAAVVSNPILESGRNFTQGFDVYDEAPQWRDRDAVATTDAALAWIRQNTATPFFLWVHYQDPHGPYSPPGGEPGRDFPGESRLRVLDGDYTPGGIPSYQALPGLFTLGAYQRLYDAEIRHLDSQVARLLEGIDSLGLHPATLLSADHGEAFGEDGYYFAHGHSTRLDQVRVPMLWRPPRDPSVISTASPRVVKTPVSVIDIAPTLLSLAGVVQPESFQGRPLPIGDERAEPLPTSKRHLFVEHKRRVSVVGANAIYERNRRPDEGAPERPYPFAMVPERAANLRGTGRLPRYGPPRPRHHELLLALDSYLATTKGLPEAPRHDVVSEELKDRLEELGYVE